jgi:two-component system, LytTR family, response regulator
MSIRVLIVDDEPLARVGIAARLQSHPDMALIGECETGEQAVTALTTMKPDLVFLDIQMPGISGLDVLRSTSSSTKPAVVFLTAHQQYALEAFDVEALDYLLKPINDDRFLRCLDRVREFTNLRQQVSQNGGSDASLQTNLKSTSSFTRRFALRVGQRVIFVLTEEIDWIEGLGDYVSLHVADKRHLLRQTLIALEAQLDPTRFQRIHRSTIVQIDRMTHIKALPNRDSIITLRDGTLLRASRTYGKGLNELMRKANS